MAPVNEKKTWREVKEKRKKWKEEKILKKIAKENANKIAEEAKTENQNQSKVPPKLKPFSTISIAVPGSILENAQTQELRTYLAGQIARAASIFQVDEVIVFDDYGDKAMKKTAEIEDADGIKTGRHCCVQLARILQYLECPQYLRKHFFPIHNDLKFAGMLNPLDSPHHLRQDNDFPFREGVVTNKPPREDRYCYVNVGLLQDAKVEKVLTPGLRVTVRMLPSPEGSKKIRGEIVSPNLPRSELGVYWGYSVRLANSLTQVFSQSPYKEGYDFTIGTSDKGTNVDEIEKIDYDHALIVFGGLQGLEEALENDETLTADDPADLFDQYINTLPNQGSRTIRTEEAIIVTLVALRTKMNAKNKLITTFITKTDL